MKAGPATVPILCIVCCVGLTVYIFAASRNDPGLRMAALVAATSTAAALIAIASTMLVGKDVTKDLPPGSVSSTKEVIQTPPLDPKISQEITSQNLQS